MKIKKVYADGLTMLWTAKEYEKILEIKKRPNREEIKRHYSHIGRMMNSGFKEW